MELGTVKGSLVLTSWMPAFNLAFALWIITFAYMRMESNAVLRIDENSWLNNTSL